MNPYESPDDQVSDLARLRKNNRLLIGLAMFLFCAAIALIVGLVITSREKPKSRHELYIETKDKLEEAEAFYELKKRFVDGLDEDVRRKRVTLLPKESRVKEGSKKALSDLWDDYDKAKIDLQKTDQIIDRLIIEKNKYRD